MSREEFNKTRWGANMYVNCRGLVYPVVSVDFEEKTVCFKDEMGEVWVSCEEVEIEN